MSEFAESINDYLQRFGIDTKPPTVYTGVEGRIIPAGARNETLTSIAGLLRKVGLAPNLIDAAIRGIASNPNAIANTMFDDGELERIIEHISGRASQPFNTDAYTVTTVTPQDYVQRLEWLIPNFIPSEGLTLLYGLPAQGKSWIAMLAALVAAGAGEWVDGYRSPKKRRVGYFDWERRGEMFKRRLKKIARNEQVELDYVEWRRPMGDVMDEMTDLVRVKGYEFVVVDSLSIAIMTADLMAAHEIIPRLFALHELHVPILLLDHQKKPQGGERPDQGTAFGSMFKEAVVSCAWQAVKTDWRNFTEGYMDFRLLHHKNNFDLAPVNLDLRLELDDEHDTVRIVPVEETPRATRILEALSHRSEMTINELISIVGNTSESVIRRDLEDPDTGLIAQGAVRISTPGGLGRGNARKYALVKWESEQ